MYQAVHAGPGMEMDRMWMDPDGYPRNLGGCGWIWIKIRGYPFSSIYLKVLSAIPGWCSDHVWASTVVNHDWGVHPCACRGKWSGLVVVVATRARVPPVRFP